MNEGDIDYSSMSKSTSIITSGNDNVKLNFLFLREYRQWRYNRESFVILGNFIYFFLMIRFGTHFRSLLKVSDEDAHIWDMSEASSRGWSSRTLDRNTIGFLHSSLALQCRLLFFLQ